MSNFADVFRNRYSALGTVSERIRSDSETPPRCLSGVARRTSRTRGGPNRFQLPGAAVEPGRLKQNERPSRIQSGARFRSGLCGLRGDRFETGAAVEPGRLKQNERPSRIQSGARVRSGLCRLHGDKFETGAAPELRRLKQNARRSRIQSGARVRSGLCRLHGDKFETGAAPELRRLKQNARRSRIQSGARVRSGLCGLHGDKFETGAAPDLRRLNQNARPSRAQSGARVRSSLCALHGDRFETGAAPELRRLKQKESPSKAESGAAAPSRPPETRRVVEAYGGAGEPTEIVRGHGQSGFQPFANGAARIRRTAHLRKCVPAKSERSEVLTPTSKSEFPILFGSGRIFRAQPGSSVDRCGIAMERFAMPVGAWICAWIRASAVREAEFDDERKVGPQCQ